MISDEVSLPPHVTAILDLFDEALHDVRFGDVDRAILAEHVEAYRDSWQREAAARAALDEARRELERERLRLEERVERAAAYARVYARDHEELAARLAEIDQLTPGKPKPKKRRRNAKKTKPEPGADAAAELPFQATGA